MRGCVITCAVCAVALPPLSPFSHHCHVMSCHCSVLCALYSSPDWMADDLDGPLAVTGTRILPAVTPPRTPLRKPLTDLDDLCTSIEVAKIFDYDASKSIYNLAHLTNNNNNTSASTPTVAATTTTSTACTTYNPLRDSGRGSALAQVPEVESEEYTETEDFKQKVNQLSEAFSRPAVGK